MIIIICAFILRIILTVYNIQVDYLPGGDLDALNFHKEALKYSEYLDQRSGFIGGKNEYEILWWYSVYIGYLYNFLGTESHLFSSIFSCCIWLLSAVFVREIAVKLDFKKKGMNIAIALYFIGFPISIIYTSLTLRETTLLFCFNLLALLMINIYKTKKIKTVIFNIASILCLGIVFLPLHNANIFFVGLYIVLLMSYYFVYKFRLKYLFITTSIILLISYLEYSGHLALVHQSIIGYQKGHMYGGQTPRAHYYPLNYFTNMNINFIEFFKHISNNIFRYFFEPTLLKVTSFKDLTLFYENTLRIVLAFFVIKKLHLQFDNKVIFIVLLLMAMTMELIYAQVTVNYGTASRHHVPIMGIWILLGCFPFRKVAENK